MCKLYIKRYCCRCRVKEMIKNDQFVVDLTYVLDGVNCLLIVNSKVFERNIKTLNLLLFSSIPVHKTRFYDGYTFQYS